MGKYFIFIPLLFLISCVKEVPIKSDVYVEPRPVFHLYLTPDSLIYADYSRVTSIADPNKTNDSALISLFRNNVFLGDMPPIGAGRYYYQNNNYKPGDSFRIYASDGLYSFFVRGKIPASVRMQVSDTQTLLIPGIGPSFAMDFTFSDTATEDNFYRLFVRKNYVEYKRDVNGNISDSSIKIKLLEIRGSELPFIENNFNNYNTSEILFSDATFNGTKSKFRIYTPGKMYGDRDVRNLNVEVVLESIEKPLFDYFNTRNAHLWQQQSITQLPGNLTGNISGGYGVAGAYTRSRYVIQFQ